MSEREKSKDCKFCHGSGTLGQGGIFRVYVLPEKLSLLIIAVSAALGIAVDPAWFWGILAGFILPAVMADFRLLLYPVVVLGKLSGKEVNCPACTGGGSIFRK